MPTIFPTVPFWLQWFQWSSGDATCGIGSRSRFKQCTDPNGTGRPNCTGPNLEVEECNCTEPCELSLLLFYLVQLTWNKISETGPSPWTAWTPCNKQCGPGGQEYRTKCCEDCIDQEKDPSCFESGIVGAIGQMRDCNSFMCGMFDH